MFYDLFIDLSIELIKMPKIYLCAQLSDQANTRENQVAANHSLSSL